MVKSYYIGIHLKIVNPLRELYSLNWYKIKNILFLKFSKMLTHIHELGQ